MVFLVGFIVRGVGSFRRGGDISMSILVLERPKVIRSALRPSGGESARRRNTTVPRGLVKADALLASHRLEFRALGLE